jgi:ParB/RepB/Spo0J family partition protein
MTRENIPDDGQMLRPDTGMLHPSPTNPRKTFAEDSLREMAESIRQVGVMQPIIVREMPEAMRLQLGTDARLEIVAGERRWRAATIAGLLTVPVLLRDLTDEQVEALQIIENLQRENLNAIDEAEGFGQLQARGMSGPLIAESVGKDKAYVYAKLKLLALCEHGRELLRQGVLIESIALLVSRIPVEEFQLDALKHVTERDPDTQETMSFRAAKAFIQQGYTKNLGKAPFALDDATLVIEAGNCIDCPDRLGNQPECPAGSANVCTNAKCHESKRQAHNIRLLALPEDTPRVEIQRAPGSMGGPTNWTDYDSAGYRLLSGINYHDKRATGTQRSYADWLKDNGESVPVAVHVDPFNGDVRIIASKLDLIAAAERIEAKHAEQAGQQRLDVTAEQIAPAATAPVSTAVERIEATPAPTSQAIQARIDKEREQRKPAAQQNSALEIAYAKYRQAVADEIVNNPPLMIAGPLLHIVARYAANNANIEFESDGQAMQVLINVIASAFAKSTRSSIHPDSLESLAESVGINTATLLDKHIPVPAGCARPNQHGVFPVQETIKKQAGNITIFIKIANTADGWRGAVDLESPNGCFSGPISTYDVAYLTREDAINHCAEELKARMAGRDYPKKPVADLTNWLTKILILSGDIDEAPEPRSAHVRYRHPENSAIGWSGHGRKPQWVVEWLAQGKAMSELEAKMMESA